MISNLSQQIFESRDYFDKILKNAQDALEKGDLTSTMAWARIAAHFAFIRHPGFYVSPELENLLLKIAQEIEKPNPIDAEPPESRRFEKTRFLHVVTECYETGGHTAFLDRWIKTTSANSTHSLVSTNNIQPLPEGLVKSITSTGGWYCSLHEKSPDLLEQALLLRQLARKWADVTVLFIQPFDPVPIVSFGVKDVPPVVFVNHADHAFWLGARITDVVANYHSYGSQLCSERRGIVESKILPIPLLRTNQRISRAEARRELGLKTDEIMLLTVGRTEKFLPFENYNFLEVLIEVLKRHPNAKLFAVGPYNLGQWKAASETANGQICAVGMVSQERLETFYEAADIYVPGFPCGSGTAMLEAGMHGIQMVGLHVNEFPNLSVEDDVSFRQLNVYVSTVTEFLKTLDSMIVDSQAYRQQVQTVKTNIQQDHCSPGWNNYLIDLLRSLPSHHSIHETKVSKPSRLDHLDLYLSMLDSEMMNNELIECSLGRLVRVYSKDLKKSDAVKMQVKTLLESITKANNLSQGKGIVLNLVDTLKFISKNPEKT